MLNTEVLETLWKAQPRPWCEHHALAVTEKGLMLGADTLLVPVVKDAYGRTTLAIDGNEERILALLSVAHGKPVSPLVLENFRAASRALAKGDRSLALICLAQSGLFALEGWNRERDPDLAAKALFQADRLICWGVDPAEMLKGLGLLPAEVTLSDWRKLAKYNHNHDERGRFASGPGGGGVRVADSRPVGTVSDAKAEDPASKGDWKAMKNPTPDRIKNEDFEAMRSALAQRKDLTDLQKFNVLSLYAWEGGPKDNGGTVAGLTPTFLSGIGAKPPTSPGETIDPYLRYMDETMRTAGGRSVPDKIGDPMAGAAFVDTVFYQGRGKGTELIQQAVNDVRQQIKQGNIDVDKTMGPATLNAYRDLADDAKTRSSLPGALAERREDWSKDKGKTLAEKDSDKKRFNWFR